MTFTTPRKKVLIAAALANSAHYHGIARYARENGWHLVSDMIFTGDFPGGWKGDGILAVLGHQPELLARILDSGVPCVAIAQTDQSPRVPCVGEDHVRIGRIAADHLLERAYRSFAWAPLRDDRPNRERAFGFQSRIAEFGGRCHVLPAAQTWRGHDWGCDWHEYRRRLVAELNQLPRPTAVFAGNDSVAANLIDACHDCGFAVPEEFAVLGSGNDPLVGESVPVPLSSVEPDHEEMAYCAAVLLDHLMNGETAPKDRVCVAPKGIVTRVSTDVTAVSDPRIARALAFIAENYSDPMLSVLDVAAAVGVSRRSLERNFRHSTGCTIREHITRTRMQEASRLLTTYPRTKTAEIAALVGIAGTGNFFRTFRRFHGVSPQVHRQRAVAPTDGRMPPHPAPAELVALEPAAVSA